MKKNIVFLFLFTVIAAFTASAQDAFSGRYVMENQAAYDADKRWIEITRNQYREIIINSNYYNAVVAYYDADNQELFYVIEKHAQYNTLMKIRIINRNAIKVFMLDDNRWQVYPSLYVREQEEL